MKKRQGASLVVFVFGISAILALASLVVDIGILINCQNELQKAVESAALVGASELEFELDTVNDTVSIDSTDIQNIIITTFYRMPPESSLVSNINLLFNPLNDIKFTSKAVRVAATADVNTYFTKFIGFNKFTITARAAAISVPAYLSSKFPTPGGSVDTVNSVLRQPIGGNINQNYNSGWEYDNVYGYPDNKALSFGPGGYITMQLPAPLVDNEGADLYIKQVGNLKGYFVFAGNDDPVTTGVIKWINISCTGIPVGTEQTGKVGAYYSDVSVNSIQQTKFYGSGYFDLGLACDSTYDGTSTTANNIKSAKYLRIIDDNVEDGFMEDNPIQPVILAGDHSSITPGINIDAVAILHHTKLVDYSDLNKDADTDGLIDILESIIGTNKDDSDSDEDGINDITEYIGRDGSGTIMTSGVPSSKIIMTSPRNAMADLLNKDNTGLGIINVK